ncbi:MAG TPA: transcription termination/antitermination NusG family protein [Gemmataceae bacterium]|nr:transcription termination/antitermination NusG family protein [Gemmataceae bacterium]
MPLLAAEPNVYPADLFDLGAEAVAAESHWWVLHTRPRQEKALARQLLEHRVPFYLPTIAKRLRIKGRNLTSHVPLFPGYAFMMADREQRVAALTTNRIFHTLPVTNQNALWNDLRQISHLITTGAAITPEDRLAPGDIVEITSGPLTGLKGKILRTATGQRFVVEVDFIQRGASVMLDDSCLTASREQFA